MALGDQVAAEHAGSGLDRAQALRAYVALIAVGLARTVRADRASRDGGRPARLVRRFAALIEAHYREHWSVADYAAALAVSPTHLGRLCRAEAGLAPSRLVEGRLVQEARRSLAYTDMSVAEIAYDLGFEDPAYFTRVFARATGLAPPPTAPASSAGRSDRTATAHWQPYGAGARGASSPRSRRSTAQAPPSGCSSSYGLRTDPTGQRHPSTGAKPAHVPTETHGNTGGPGGLLVGGRGATAAQVSHVCDRGKPMI